MLKSGILLPVSQRETVLLETKSFSANCSCVSPFSFRRSFNNSPVFDWFICSLTPPFAIMILYMSRKYHDTKREMSVFGRTCCVLCVEYACFILKTELFLRIQCKSKFQSLLGALLCMLHTDNAIRSPISLTDCIIYNINNIIQSINRLIITKARQPRTFRPRTELSRAPPRSGRSVRCRYI